MKKGNGRNDTALVIVYFGDVPHYIQFFLDSCGRNNDIDFLFFADCNFANFKTYENTYFYSTTLGEFNKLCNNKLGIEGGVVITHPYKLCDLKPAWCHLYEDYLSEYDFVGYCDIDLIFGTIKHFFTEDVKKRYHAFTITTEYMSGAFNVFKNTKSMRMLYQRASGWEYIFSDNRHWAFDEYLRLDETKADDAKKYDLEFFSDMIFAATDISLENSRYIGFESRPTRQIHYKKHEWFNEEGEEFIFFHFVGAKQHPFWTIPSWNVLPASFHVNKYGFYKDGESQIGFKDVLSDKFLRKQVMTGLNKKIVTAKRLLKNFNIVSFIKAIQKYL